jgi:hypothetical protein
MNEPETLTDELLRELGQQEQRTRAVRCSEPEFQIILSNQLLILRILRALIEGGL